LLPDSLQAETKNTDTRISQVRFMEPPAPKVTIEEVSSSAHRFALKAVRIAVPGVGD